MIYYLILAVVLGCAVGIKPKEQSERKGLLALVVAFIAIVCGFTTTAWVIFGIGIVIFFLALICNKVEER